MRFATSADALWTGNFRDLLASMTRVATLADGGNTETIVRDGIRRLQALWRRFARPARTEGVDLAEALGPDRAAGLGQFDAVQLAHVVAVCRQSQSLSDAGRILFSVSRETKAKPNDADRLRKYLNRFGLGWHEVCGRG